MKFCQALNFHTGWNTYLKSGLVQFPNFTPTMLHSIAMAENLSHHLISFRNVIPAKMWNSWTNAIRATAAVADELSAFQLAASLLNSSGLGSKFFRNGLNFDKLRNTFLLFLFIFSSSLWLNLIWHWFLTCLDFLGLRFWKTVVLRVGQAFLINQSSVHHQSIQFLNWIEIMCY